MYMDVDCENNASCQNQVSRISPEDVKVIKMKETQFRGIDFHDPNEILFRFATSHFYTRERILTIESIDVIRNDKLEAAFKKKQNEFKKKNIPHTPIFAYHGTPRCNIENIITHNFDKTKSRRQYHGRGHYFSESPSFALPYSMSSRALILCKILTGRQYTGPLRNWPHHDSKLVFPDINQFSQILVVGDKDQILPCAVIHLNTPVNHFPTLPPLPLSFPVTTVSSSNLVTISPPAPTFIPNIIHPNYHIPSAFSTIPKLNQASGIQKQSTNNLGIRTSSSSNVPLHVRNFSWNPGAQLSSSIPLKSNDPSSSGDQNKRVGKSLGTIAEAVFKPILKIKKSTDK